MRGHVEGESLSSESHMFTIPNTTLHTAHHPHTPPSLHQHILYVRGYLENPVDSWNVQFLQLVDVDNIAVKQHHPITYCLREQMGKPEYGTA